MSVRVKYLLKTQKTVSVRVVLVGNAKQCQPKLYREQVGSNTAPGLFSIQRLLRPDRYRDYTTATRTDSEIKYDKRNKRRNTQFKPACEGLPTTPNGRKSRQVGLN